MNASKIQEEPINDDDESERYFDYYIKKNTMWLSIFLSLFVLLDVIAIFLTTNYSFLEIVLYFGILMILVGSGVLYFVWREKNYFWAALASLFLGLTTFIEIIIHLSRVSMGTSSLIMAILSLLVSLGFLILPILLVFLKYRKEFKQK
ncbi:MAG: hypothetical protein FK730_16825 [Asgard group archaeon]|nr:hypothetical protein [Asgard group archaeon]